MFLKIYDLDYEIEKLTDKETALPAETPHPEVTVGVMLSDLDYGSRPELI